MDSNNTLSKYGVIGAGSFGLAIANLLAENGDVLIYARNEQQVKDININHLSKNYVMKEAVVATNDLKTIAAECQLIFPIVPIS